MIKMELITSQQTENKLFVYLHGRVDSTNAAEAEEKIDACIAGSDADELILDTDDLLYISSAGLRIVLRLLKKKASVKIINASPEVYDIFEMTGFTEMMTIEKAYKKVSVEGCKVIGRGANGEVYRLDDDTIIKVYLNADSLSDIQRERELARKAFVLGVPTAMSYDVVRVGNSYGSVFELLDTKSLNDLLMEDENSIDEVVDMNVELLKKIHATEVQPGDMPNMKDIAVNWVEFLKDYLEPAKWEKLYKLVCDIPENNHMIHGDYHTKNVMIQNGETLLIDMDTLSYGDPIFEFASMFNAYVGFCIINEGDAKTFLGISNELARKVWDKTIRKYFGTDDKEFLQTIENKASTIGYARIMRRQIRRGALDTEQGRKNNEFFKNKIESLVDGLDKLTF